jgi:hypothetical protein
MAELSLAIVRLFNNALEWFRIVRVGLDTDRDMETYQLRLDIAGLRLSRWGKSTGLDTCTASQTSASLTPDERILCEETLKQINKLFEDAPASQKKAEHPGAEDPQTHDLSAGLNALYLERTNKNFASKFKTKAKWAMYKREECEALADAIEKLVESLISTFSNNDDIMGRMRGLCKEEVSRLDAKDDEGLKALRKVIDEHDLLLREAIESNGKGMKVGGESATHDNRAIFGAGNKGMQQVANYGTQTNSFGGT